jgi:hypothetical protein
MLGTRNGKGRRSKVISLIKVNEKNKMPLEIITKKFI